MPAGQLVAAAVLDEQQLSAIAGLEQRVTEFDGGRLKLEWGVLRDRRGPDINQLLWVIDGTVVGFVGLYAFGDAAPEIAGMVDPSCRRQGIGSGLLLAARELLAERGHARALLVSPRSTETGASFAAAQLGNLEHSEHFMVLGPNVAVGTDRADVTVRTATQEDIAAGQRILAAAFDWVGPASDWSGDARVMVLVVEVAGRVVGTLRVHNDPGSSGIYGFAVDPDLHGQGIGRSVLRRVCQGIRTEDPERRVTLEVAVDNDRALGLYESVGFVRTTTEDYFEIAVTTG